MTAQKNKRYLKPARTGLVVRQPSNGQPLPAEGAFVDWSAYWMRRMADGSVVNATPPKKTQAPAKTPATDQEG